jgi:hypothetical protein
MLIDLDASEVLSWRRDAYAVARGLQSVEQIVCKGKRFIEASQGRSDVDHQPLVRPEMLALIHLVAGIVVSLRVTN